MQLIFLSEQDLTVLDYGYATDEYEIVLDALVPQKSSFVVNKQSLKAGIGDLLLVKENGYPYVGIITSIEKDNKAALDNKEHEVSDKYRDIIADLKEQIRVLQETQKTQKEPAAIRVRRFKALPLCLR